MPNPLSRPVWTALGEAVCALHRSTARDDVPMEHAQRWAQRLDQLAADFLPSGSGFDSGCAIDVDNSSPWGVGIRTAFHHMDEHGCYDGWSDHTVTVRPDWHGPRINVSGRDRNGIKEYIGDLFAEMLAVSVVLVADPADPGGYGHYVAADKESV